MTQKCIWCNRQTNKLKQIAVLAKGQIWLPLQDGKAFVCPEHEEEFRIFNDRSRRYGILFISLEALFVFTLVVSGFLGNKYYFFGYLFLASLAAIGLVIFIFPFCSPTTFEFMSVKKSIKIARIIGGVIFAIGAIVIIIVLLSG